MVCESWKAKLDTYLDGELRRWRCATSTSMSIYAPLARRMPLCGFKRSALFRRLESALFPLRTSETDRAEHCQKTATPAVQLRMGDGDSGHRYSCGRGVDCHLQQTRGSAYRTGLQRGSGSARGDARQFFAGRCDLDRPAHGEAVVSRKDPLRVRSAGTSELRILPDRGRMAYLDQTPGAHLIYDVRKHHISVFVFQGRFFRLLGTLEANTFAPKKRDST